MLTIEFFVERGRLVANEMAPRVHNSGHWTIEGAATSQFENHLRAILGWPLGDTRALGHAAMVNLIGTMPDRDALLALPGVHLHDYGKTPRTGPQARPLHARSRHGPGPRPPAAAGTAAPATLTGRAVRHRPTSDLTGFFAVTRRALIVAPGSPRMYLEHFQLKELPFRLSPDPAFLYPSPVHSRAKAYMESTIWFTDGFVIITGEIGSGKTTLIETFLKEIDQDVVVAQLNQTQVSPIEFLQTMLAQFGFSPFKMKKAELITTLNSFLIEQYANGRKVLLIVDEAQNLSNKVLEEVRLLSGVETTKEKVLRIILAGQPELNAKIDSPELMQLRQRVRLRFHLSALSEQDTVNYIDHRLQVAGSNGRALFAPETYPVIYRYSGGIPRLINTLCDTALLAAFAQDHATIGLEDLQAAIGELQWVEYARDGDVEARRR